ncbi:penicillin acylase family protein [Pedobacter sp. SYSU D00535]|uniref:penicillin acylase family protein n=1 Tax=Pedobacter sp. SYSU D00535 TaxID=2810308 RepID=UPI001A965CA3|nr:penicillin acylase family protein [Pedobacter sp. SYSU D00535]
MKTFKAVFLLAITIITFVALDKKLGMMPPLGKFLNPFKGFWQKAELQQLPDKNFEIEGLISEVEILFDDHAIPHIFAENDHDLYFAQGYVTAMHRLWQLDFQTRFAAGRLSEVVGEKALELDRYQRRLGMTYGAENMVKELEKHPKIKAMTEAYADGINAYISSLSAEDYPVEFKLLDYKPEKWTVLNTGLLLKLMSATLAGGSDEFYMSNALGKFGPEVMNDLFPNYPFREEPIIPKGTPWKFKPIEPEASTGTSFIGHTDIKTREKREGIGSNNWAVSGSRTASGFPLLANDPHLDLTLPAIWYQIQLVGPGINVNGVSIPGAPGVIIGFNQQVAWGVTNVGSDVLDWYEIKFKNNRKEEYFHEEGWRKTSKRIETIKVRGGKTLSDTVYYTHHGPVVYTQKPKNFGKASNIPAGYALRWIAHDPSVDVATFYYLNRAKNYNDYRKALTFYTAPAQNFAFASVENDIAITANGYFPLKRSGHGKFLLNGSEKQAEWQGRIPVEHNPTVLNPPRGFVSSANQPSTDRSYPYYLNWDFAGYERANRINTRLTAMQNATADSLRKLQTDNFSVLAQNVLPLMTQALKSDHLNATEQEAFNLLSKWNYTYDAQSIAASIFEIWHKDLHKKIWDEFHDPEKPMRTPSRDRTVQLLLKEPQSRWFDVVATPVKESREQLIQASFKFAIDSLSRKFGLLGKKWQWGFVKNTHIPHLAKIPGFGSGLLFTGGSKTSVNALAESNGPSWRMVVDLGRTPKAYGIFPGGQSGNPGSVFYDDMISSWTEGQLDELLFLRSKEEKNPRIKGRLTLSKK